MKVVVRKNFILAVLVLQMLIGVGLSVKTKEHPKATLTDSDFDDMLNSPELNQDFLANQEKEERKPEKEVDMSFLDDFEADIDCMEAASELMVIFGQYGIREYATKLTEAIAKGQDPDKIPKPKNMDEIVSKVELIEELLIRI